MQIRRYEASNAREALTKIKKDLGEDAIILSTKRLKGGRYPRIEVTAARDDNSYGKAEHRKKGEGSRPDIDIFSSLKNEIDELKTLMLGVKNGELIELRETLNTFFDTMGMSKKDGNGKQLSSIYYYLVSRGLSRQNACKLINVLENDFSAGDGEDYEDAFKAVMKLIAKSIDVSHNGTDAKRVVAFVGPTGVGKTTTLAKLAARFALEKGLSVALITADTYRIAAAEQLRVYAKIIGLPVEIVSEKKELELALKRFADKDIIMVDTPGKSRNDKDHMEKLRDFLALDIPVETNLLLSLTSSQENMLDTAARFEALNYDNIIFTKLDECVCFGSIYNVIDQVGKPVAYVTNGQNVPQDIEKANPAKLARLIMESTLN